MNDIESLQSEVEALKTEIKYLKSELNKVTFGELSYALLGLKIEFNKQGDIICNEVEIVDIAIKESGLSLQEIVRKGTLQKAKYLSNVCRKQTTLKKMNNKKLITQNFLGVAEFRINKAYVGLKKYNQKQLDNSSRFCITKNLIHNLTGSRTSVINSFFEKNIDDIKSHNQFYKLHYSDNRKKKGIKIKEILNL